MSENRVVVTGQQVGLLGGPLYTTYKVLGAVFHARQLDGEAVYWLETNDADFNEINHIDWLDAEGQLRTLTWDLDSRGFSCGYIEIDASLMELLETFFSTLRQTDFTPGLKEMAFDCYTPGRTLGEASQMLAGELFGQFKLRIFTPFDPGFRTFSQEILRNEAERTPEGEQCNCFCMVGKQRKAVFKQDGVYRLRDGTVVDLTRHDLVPNVRTRSICQDAYFHTHTYVAGPGEVSYLAELGPGFQFHGIKPAAVQPRMSVYLLEPKVQRLMKKIGLSLEEIVGIPRDDLLKHVLKDKTSFDFNESLQKGNHYTEEYLGQLASLGVEARNLKISGNCCSRKSRRPWASCGPWKKRNTNGC